MGSPLFIFVFETQIAIPSKNEFCAYFYIRNWSLSSETMVYMWIESYLSNSLYKSFQVMVCAIKLPMQWRASNWNYSYVLHETLMIIYNYTFLDYIQMKILLFKTLFNIPSLSCTYLGAIFFTLKTYGDVT